MVQRINNRDAHGSQTVLTLGINDVTKASVWQHSYAKIEREREMTDFNWDGSISSNGWIVFQYSGLIDREMRAIRE